ncbi:MAG: hypothetical protein ACK5ME_04225 [Parahaliea sp.]
MSTDREGRYLAEWMLLQKQYDSYEKFSLLIKLTNIILVTWLLFVGHAGFWAAAVAAILWLQDGIWKTYQSRINTRLLVVEVALAEEPSANEAGPLQYNRSWLAMRHGVTGLLKEYLCHAMAPTVAYPHVLLIALTVLVQYWRIA